MLSSYYSLVKYVGRHVSARVPRDYLQVPEGHRWLRDEVDRLRIGLQQQNRTLPPVFMNMVLRLIEDEKVELSEELYKFLGWIVSIAGMTMNAMSACVVFYMVLVMTV